MALQWSSALDWFANIKGGSHVLAGEGGILFHLSEVFFFLNELLSNNIFYVFM